MIRYVVLLLVACAPSSSTVTANPVERGDAARILCEAECRRSQRCDIGDEDVTECLARCPELPVRNPAVWSAAWATDVAKCVDASSCKLDHDEACLSSIDVGLTPYGQAQARACSCIPPFDWK